MGVAANWSHPLFDIAPKAPLLKFLEITPEHQSTTEQQLDGQDKHEKSRKPTNLVHMLTESMGLCCKFFLYELCGS